jgi:AAA domain
MFQRLGFDLCEYITPFLSSRRDFRLCTKAYLVRKLQLLGHFCDPEQKKALYDICLRNRNILLTAGAGRGKSYVVQIAKKFLDWLEIKHHTVAYTALAAMNVDGKTIHSSFPLYTLKEWNPDSGQVDFPSYHLENILEEWRTATKYRILFIDEVSMVHPVIMEQIYFLLHHHQRSKFKCKFIAVGDFRQLPPMELAIIRKPSSLRSYFFQHFYMNHYHPLTLSINHRQQNNDFSKVLDLIGQGYGLETEEERIRRRLRIKMQKKDEENETEEKHQLVKAFVLRRRAAFRTLSLEQRRHMVHLYFLNAQVDKWNADCLSKLPGETHLIHLSITQACKKYITQSAEIYKQSNSSSVMLPNHIVRNLDSLRALLNAQPHIAKELDNRRIHSELEIKVGCRIMFTRNTYRLCIWHSEAEYLESAGLIPRVKRDLEEITHIDIINGQQAILLQVSSYGILAHLDRTKLVIFFPYLVETIRVDERVNRRTREFTELTIRFLPVTLCYALTINKAQGLTLGPTVVSITPSQHLTYNLIYVALSRCRQEEDLFIDCLAPPPREMDSQITQFYADPTAYCKSVKRTEKSREKLNKKPKIT